MRDLTRANRPTARRTFLGAAALAAAAPAGGAHGQPAAPPAAGPAEGEVLIHGAHLVTMDSALGDIPGGSVLVRGGAIVEVGRDIRAPGAERIDAAGKLLLPGLVDVHWHLWATLARNLAGTARGGFVPSMAALSPHFTPEDSALAVRLSVAEAIHSGITALHNFAHNLRSREHAAAEIEAQAAGGLRGRFDYGYPQDLPRDRVMDLDGLGAARRALPPGLTLGIAARGPDRTEKRVWRAEWEAARAMRLPVATHIASDRRAAAGNAIATMARDGLLGPDVQLIHATHASADDFRRIRDAGSPVGISPWTELEVGYGLAPVAAMKEAGLRLGLGVDNLGLAGSADPFGLMRVTVDLAAGTTERQGAVTGRDALRWTTIGAAETVGLAAQAGSITPGKRADLILLRLDTPNTATIGDLDATITHAVQPANVDLVMADGRVRKRDGRLVDIDLPTLIAEGREALARLRDRAGI